MKVDIVIPLGANSKTDNEELRYCLRSIQKNLTEVGKIFIATNVLPNWMDRDLVTHICCDDIYKRNKDANLIRKTLITCDARVSKQFIRMSDDQLFMQPVKVEFLMNTAFYVDKLEKFISELPEEKNRWMKRLMNVRDKFPFGYNYDSHIPTIYDRDGFVDCMFNYDWDVDEEGRGFTINSLYFNHYTPIQTFKVDSDISSMNGLFFNYKKLDENLRQKFLNLFPNKSIYERD